MEDSGDDDGGYSGVTEPRRHPGFPGPHFRLRVDFFVDEVGEGHDPSQSERPEESTKPNSKGRDNRTTPRRDVAPVSTGHGCYAHPPGPRDVTESPTGPRGRPTRHRPLPEHSSGPTTQDRRHGGLKRTSGEDQSSVTAKTGPDGPPRWDEHDNHFRPPVGSGVFRGRLRPPEPARTSRLGPSLNPPERTRVPGPVTPLPWNHREYFGVPSRKPKIYGQEGQ